MLLPSGTIRALKDNPDAIVCVVVVCLAIGGIACRAPALPVLLIVALALAFYDRRRTAHEAHELRLAEQKVAMAVAKADEVKARHLDLLGQAQPSLPLRLPNTKYKPVERKSQMLSDMHATLTAQAVAALACMFLGVIVFMLRADSGRRHKIRLGQLEKSAELLEFHARHLGTFLDDPSAPMLLKQTAMNFAVFMDDRRAVYEFASWMSAQPLGQSLADEETREIIQEFDRLSHVAPVLASTFSSALICGAFGAILRWPESSRLFDLSGPAMVADGSREIAAAVCATKMLPKPLFDVRMRHTTPDEAYA
jgi:hypothetical protein